MGPKLNKLIRSQRKQDRNSYKDHVFCEKEFPWPRVIHEQSKNNPYTDGTNTYISKILLMKVLKSTGNPKFLRHRRRFWLSQSVTGTESDLHTRYRWKDTQRDPPTTHDSLKKIRTTKRRINSREVDEGQKDIGSLPRAKSCSRPQNFFALQTWLNYSLTVGLSYRMCDHPVTLDIGVVWVYDACPRWFPSFG